MVIVTEILPLNQKKKIGCKFIRVDPDEENFNVF